MLDPAPVDIVDTATPAVSALLIERCDTCHSAAYLGARVNGTMLVYCVHHANEYLPRLRQIADLILDCRHMLSCE
jgi:hypothetical protein